MKKILLFGCFVLCLSLNGCQCSNPPTVGPVEGDNAEVLPTETPTALPALA